MPYLSILSGPQSQEDLVKTVSVSEARQQLNALVEWAIENQDGVVIEKYNKPKAVLISYEDFEKYQQIKAKEQQQAAWAALQALAQKVSDQNKNLTAEEADEVADSVVREAVASLEQKGQIRFDD